MQVDRELQSYVQERVLFLDLCSVNAEVRFWNLEPMSLRSSSTFFLPLIFLSTFAFNMSYFLPHLPSGWHVDEAIKSEEDRVVVIRFGHDWDSQCMTMDETLHGVAEKVQNFAVIYLVDITEVPDFNKVCRIIPPADIMWLIV